MRSETLKSFGEYLTTALQQGQKRVELLEHLGHREASESRVVLIVKKAARNLEAELAKACADARAYRQYPTERNARYLLTPGSGGAVSNHARILHGLSKPEMVQRLVSGILCPDAQINDEAMRSVVERLELIASCIRQA